MISDVQFPLAYCQHSHTPHGLTVLNAGWTEQVTRCLATMNLKPECIDDLDYTPQTEREEKVLSDWEKKLAAKYVVCGTLQADATAHGGASRSPRDAVGTRASDTGAGPAACPFSGAAVRPLMQTDESLYCTPCLLYCLERTRLSPDSAAKCGTCVLGGLLTSPVAITGGRGQWQRTVSVCSGLRGQARWGGAARTGRVPVAVCVPARPTTGSAAQAPVQEHRCARGGGGNHVRIPPVAPSVRLARSQA